MAVSVTALSLLGALPGCPPPVYAHATIVLHTCHVVVKGPQQVQQVQRLRKVAQLQCGAFMGNLVPLDQPGACVNMGRKEP